MHSHKEALSNAYILVLKRVFVLKSLQYHLQYKHPGTFANRKYEELSYARKYENVRPHYSHSSRENSTLSSGTSPLASYQRKYTPRGLVSLRLIGFSLVKQ